MLRVTIPWVLAGCVATDYVTEHGDVYECQLSTRVVEVCTRLDRAELEQDIGGVCWATRRLWPRVTGCIWSCEPHAGCNSHNGCWGCGG